MRSRLFNTAFEVDQKKTRKKSQEAYNDSYYYTNTASVVAPLVLQGHCFKTRGDMAACGRGETTPTFYLQHGCYNLCGRCYKDYTARWKRPSNRVHQEHQGECGKYT